MKLKQSPTLVFKPVIRQIVQMPWHQHLEHQYHVNGLGSHLALPVLGMHPAEARLERPQAIRASKPTKGSPISVSCVARSSTSHIQVEWFHRLNVSGGISVIISH
ncbi:hypothetical protein [Methyloglobulus sp.]|uniref:hypothetical protein n=1 Tax=Methyloglobulus sp. TaxID=2518622 RepID=UPI003989B333